MGRRHQISFLKFLEIAVACLSILFLIFVFGARVEASIDGDSFEISEHAANPPGPRVQPRPLGPAPLPPVRTSEKIWVLRGEVHAEEDAFVCRAKCRTEWESQEFEVLQSTRGSEDWQSHQNERAVCRVRMSGLSLMLHGGSWSTPSLTPEDTLCFVVISQQINVEPH